MWVSKRAQAEEVGERIQDDQEFCGGYTLGGPPPCNSGMIRIHEDLNKITVHNNHHYWVGIPPKLYGSFPKWRNPNIDLHILWSLRWSLLGGLQKKAPLIWENTHIGLITPILVLAPVGLGGFRRREDHPTLDKLHGFEFLDFPRTDG